VKDTLTPLLLCAALGAALPAAAQERERLISMINAYRANPPSCEGRRMRPLPPLRAHPALSSVHVDAGQFLQQALEQAGYEVARAEGITVSGADDARAVMADIGESYCRTLLSNDFSTIGASRDGDSWLILLAEPAAAPRVSELPGLRDTGQAILRAANAARRNGARCGERSFAPAPALVWNGALGDAALAHSRDMATQRYLSHQSRDGRGVSDRAVQAGYRWRSVGENIAVGQESADDVIAGWMDSPGHCANIMNPLFRDMGAAYGIRGVGRDARVYWTQMFGMQR
jgi:uncharacterized protein YkwD